MCPGRSSNALCINEPASLALSIRPERPPLAPTNPCELNYLVFANRVMTTDERCLLQSITALDAPRERLPTRQTFRKTLPSLPSSLLTRCRKVIRVLFVGTILPTTLIR